MNRSLTAAAVAVLALAGLALAAGQQLPAELEERLGHVRAELDAVKGELPLYSCCIDPACNFCALAAGMCPCGDNVNTEAGVCGECYLGWQAGKGHVPGVSADRVRTIHGQMLQEMYDKIAEHFSGHAHEHDPDGGRP